jgi:hypothetical protein
VPPIQSFGLIISVGKVQIFKRDFWGGRWYRSLPVLNKNAISFDMQAFDQLSMKIPPNIFILAKFQPEIVKA